MDLGAIAVLAGWNQLTTNMLALHATVLGGVLNKMVSLGDSTWGSRWGVLERSLRAYCIVDVHHGQVVYILASLLLWDLFPDLNGTCYVTCTLL